MRSLAAASILVLAFAAGVGVGTSRAPFAGGPLPVHAAAGERPAASTPLGFLADGEPMDVQARQLNILMQMPPEERWKNYIAPYLASQGVADAAVVEQDGTMEEAADTPAELDAFRAKYAQFTADTQRLLDLIPPEQRMDIKQRVAAAQAGIPSMSYDELASLKAAFSDYPGFWSTPTWAANMLAGSGGGGGLQLGGKQPLQPLVKPTVPPSVPQVPNCKSFGMDPICGDCPVAPAGGYITIAVLKSVALAGKFGCQFIPPDLLTGTTEIPNPVNVICVGVRVGLELAAAAVELAYELANRCNEGVFGSIIATYLDTTISSRASQQSHDFHRAWNLRTDIEDNLLDLLDKRISTFQLPASQDGFLDRTNDLSVDWIVEDTINMQAAAGYDVRNAQSELSAARVLLAGGEYKGAYARYRYAYRAAVRVGRELPAATPTP